MSQNRRSQAHGDNGKSGNKTSLSKDDSFVSYKSERKYQAANPKRSTAGKTKVTNKLSKSMDHLNALQNDQSNNSRLRTYPEIVPNARSRLPILEQKYLRQISSAPEEPKVSSESPLTSRTYKKEVELSRQISSAPEGQTSALLDDPGLNVAGYISPRDLVTSTPKELDTLSSRRSTSHSHMTPQNKFLMGVAQGVGAENTLSSIHSEVSGTDIMKTGVNRPKTQGMRRDHTFVSHGSNLSSTLEKAEENNEDNLGKANRSISSRGSTIRYRDRQQAGSKVAGLRKDKTAGKQIKQPTKFRPREQVKPSQVRSSQSREVSTSKKEGFSLPGGPDKTVVTEEPMITDDEHYESLPSRENTIVPDVDDDVEIGEEARDIVKKDSKTLKQLPVSYSPPKQRKTPAKQKAQSSYTMSRDNKIQLPSPIVPPIKSSQVTAEAETSSNLASVTNNDSLASTNLAESLVTENDSAKEEESNTGNVKGKIKQGGKISSRASNSVKRKPSQKKVRPYAKVNNSKRVPHKVQKADSFLKIEGKPPKGARPRSARYGLDYTHRSKQSAEDDLLSKSADVDTIGRVGWYCVLVEHGEVLCSRSRSVAQKRAVHRATKVC